MEQITNNWEENLIKVLDNSIIKSLFINQRLLNSENILKSIKSPEVPSPEVPVSTHWTWEPQFLSNKDVFLSNNNIINNRATPKVSQEESSQLRGIKNIKTPSKAGLDLGIKV